MQPLLDNMSLTIAAARDDNEFCTAIVLDEFAFDETFPHGTVCRIRDGKPKSLGLFPMAFNGITYADDTIIAVSEGGDVQIFTGEDVQEDGIDDITGPILDVLAIGGEIFVCGANHQVYRRTGFEQWVDIGPQERDQQDFPSNHFKAIDGFSVNELYCAGRDGVIWWFDGRSWTPIQAGTNLSFLCVTCGDDGRVYLGGQAGVVAAGRGDEFTIYTPDDPMSDIWGIARFKGKVYTSMMRALSSWNAEDGFEIIPDAMELAETFYTLEIGENTLWSVGAKDVLRFDGEVWEDVDHVQDD